MKKQGCKPGHVRMGNKCVKKACSDAISFFGLTNDLNCGFWIFPDGKMLDGCYDKNRKDKVQLYNNNHKEEDEALDSIESVKKRERPAFRHYDVIEVLARKHPDYKDTYDQIAVEMDFVSEEQEKLAWDKFMNDCNAIRFWNSLSRILVECNRKPTEKQVQTIVRSVRENPSRGIYLADNDNIDRIENPRPLDIQRWISRCWK